MRLLCYNKKHKELENIVILCMDRIIKDLMEADDLQTYGHKIYLWRCFYG